MGNVSGLFYASDGRDGRIGAGSDDGPLRLQTGSIHRDILRRFEVGSMPEVELHPKLPESIRIVVHADGNYGAAHSLHHRREVHLGLDRLEPELLGAIYKARDSGAFHQGLGRDAAVVKTVAVQLVPLGARVALAPSDAPPAAATRPAVPPPITTKSYRAVTPSLKGLGKERGHHAIVWRKELPYAARLSRRALPKRSCP